MGGGRRRQQAQGADARAGGQGWVVGLYHHIIDVVDVVIFRKGRTAEAQGRCATQASGAEACGGQREGQRNHVEQLVVDGRARVCFSFLTNSPFHCGIRGPFRVFFFFLSFLFFERSGLGSSAPPDALFVNR